METHCIPRISVPPQNSPAAAAAATTIVSFRRSLSAAKPYGQLSNVDFNAIQTGNTSAAGATGFHDICASLANRVSPWQRGRWVRKRARLFFLSSFLSSRLLTPLPEKEAIHGITVWQGGRAVAVMAWASVVWDRTERGLQHHQLPMDGSVSVQSVRE